MGTGRSLPPRNPRKDSTVSTTTTSARTASLCPLLILLLGGCHQSANPAIPLSPVGPLGGSTRVPPPATGSYAVPNGYYQGQASLAPNSSSTLAAGAMEARTLTPVDPPTLRAAGEASVAATGPAAASAEVRTASHQNQPVSQAAATFDASSSTPVGSGLAPRIPDSALQHTSTGDATLRPQLRGMEVVDLSSPEMMQPIDPPSLRVVDAGTRYGASDSWSGIAPPAFKSLSPAQQSNVAAGEQAQEVPSTSQPTAASAANSAAGAGTAAKAGGAAKTDSAALPWRKPRL